MLEDDKPSLDELMHYGVKGMKWGIRKGKVSDRVTHLAQKAKKLPSKAKSAYYRNPTKRDRAEASARRRTMSDAELDRRIKRLEKEKKLKQLTQEDISSTPDKVDYSKTSWVKEGMDSAGYDFLSDDNSNGYR